MAYTISFLAQIAKASEIQSVERVFKPRPDYYNSS